MVGILLHHITGLPNAKSGTTLGNYTLCHVTPAIPRSHSVNINTTLRLVGGVRFLCIVLATSANHQKQNEIEMLPLLDLIEQLILST